jgi:hypothetical protein
MIYHPPTAVLQGLEAAKMPFLRTSRWAGIRILGHLKERGLRCQWLGSGQSTKMSVW